MIHVAWNPDVDRLVDRVVGSPANRAAMSMSIDTRWLSGQSAFRRLMKVILTRHEEELWSVCLSHAILRGVDMHVMHRRDGGTNVRHGR